MKFRIINKLIASVLVLVLGTGFQAKANEGVLDFSVPDGGVVLSTPRSPRTRKTAPTASSQKPETVNVDRSNVSTRKLQTAAASIAKPGELDFDSTATAPQYERQDTNETSIQENSLPTLPSTAARLFATKRSPGAIAVGAAEGNLTLTGIATSLYSGHIDPGNHVVNRGFCSWNKSKNLTVREADRLCLAALQRQSASTQRRLNAVGVDLKPFAHTAALVNGTDLWNQSNSAGPQFASAYKKALTRGLSGNRAVLTARVEAFRNGAGVLDASGLFGICLREPYYRSQLAGLKPYSESWRWQCIALDQRRRVKQVDKALKLNVKDTIASPEPEERAVFSLPARPKNRRDVLPDLPMSDSSALSFEPVSESSAIAPSRGKIRKVAAFSVTGGAIESRIDRWAFNLRNKAKSGDNVAGYLVTSPYGYRVHPVSGRSHFHAGVDLNTPSNTPIYAIGKPGTKTILRCWADVKGGGLVATMTSPSFPDLQFEALHLYWCKARTNGPKIKVDAGVAIAGTGNTGTSTGPHLHFQIRDVETGRKISPPKGFISWALTGTEPKPSEQLEPGLTIVTGKN